MVRLSIIARISIALMSMTLLLGSTASLAVEQAKAGSHESVLKTLFMTQAMRERIDLQRQSYLYPEIKKKDDIIIPNTVQTPRFKKIYIPPKVVISAVIIKPDGTATVRVNNQYNKSPSKYIHMDFTGSTSDGVPITVMGKTKVVPVGTTLMTRQHRLIKTYKLEDQDRKAALPKTTQTAVKTRLQQLQVLTPNDK